ncbi:MAG: restriction endonuclease subunit S, partial [Bifidobacteriaceae bacterium]|nr:restriction endonuclease subunit S [Bifidobacteriaceae bacterium]
MSGKAEDAGAENMQSENMRQDDMRQDDMRAENAGSESGAAAKLTCGVSVAGVNAACIGSNAKPAAENARAESNISAKNAAAESNAGAGEDAESAAGPAARPDSVSGVSGRSPRLRFAGFTQPWQTRKLGELFEEYSEKNHPELPPLSVVQGGGTVLRDESDRNLQYDKSGLDRYKAVWENDFILHLRSFEGGLEKATVEGLISPAYHTFRGKGIDPRFYYLYFRSHEFVSKKLVPHIYGIRDGKSIDIEGMKSIDVPYPSVGEQRQIGMFFSGLDRIISVQERKTELLRLSKKYFLQNMFPRRGESAPRLRVHGFT